MLSAALVVVITTSVFEVLVKSQFMVEMEKSMNDKALTGHAFRNLTMKNIVECFLACLEDCLCITFQLCNNTECQLLSSNQFQSPSAMVTMIGCSYFNMAPNEQANTMTRGNCNLEGWKCSNPCKNHAPHEMIFPQDHISPRFECICLPGYTGNLCQYAKSCRAYINGSRVPGKYEVFDDNMNPFEVFCDFDSNSTMTWTLVQSYEYQNRQTFGKSYHIDWPVNENSPLWDSYRLSKSRMQFIQEDSNKFRITCKYDTDGVVYRDYLQATNDQLDILTFVNKERCTLVEYIDIRGHKCFNCAARMYQNSVETVHCDSFHTTGWTDCEFRPANGSVSCDGLGEDNFGWYDCANPAHRCSSSPTATTQTWLGGH